MKVSEMKMTRVNPTVYAEIQKIAQEDERSITVMVNRLLTLGITAYKQGKGL